MKIFIWRHNRRFHSWSMLSEPNINQAVYTDAVVIVQAEDEEQAYELIAQREDGWVVEELKRLKPRIIAADQPEVVFADVRGD
ncbi:MAG: hypothetical protein P4N41_06030 [Negativicutes bacterium]|nr:hypothetical protein [Negativicutes bacterium]